MKFVDEFRDAQLGRVVGGEILSLLEPGRHYKVIECVWPPHTSITL